VPTHNAQPERDPTPALPHTSRRQLTLGECIAMAELSQRFDRAALKDVPMAAIMRVVDAMRVCTTCGQVEQNHDPERRWAGACTSYAPREP